MNIFGKLEKKMTPALAVAPRRVINGWKAIAVMPGEKCCQWARLCTGKRFLIPEVPRLPLQGCDSQYCECKYRHFADRRAISRRSIKRGGNSKHIDADRREAASRRIETAAQA